MRIVCPSCQAAYEVPAAVLDAARVVRCARCSADFTPSVETASDAPPDLPPVVAPMEERLSRPAGRVRQQAAARSRLRVSVALSWALSLTVLVAAGWGFVAWRHPIARAWPAASRVYGALGY